MNISYNWLKEYVNFDLTPDETAAALTSIGLETVNRYRLFVVPRMWLPDRKWW